MSTSISVADVLRRARSAYLGQAASLLSLSAAAVGGVASTSAFAAITLSPWVGSLALVIDCAVLALFTSAVVQAVADTEAGRQQSGPWRLISSARQSTPRVLLVGIVATVATWVASWLASLPVSVVFFAILLNGGASAAGTGIVVVMSFFALAPALVLITLWSVVAPVVVLEQPRGLASLGRSRQLVRGNGWRVFGVVAVLLVMLGAYAAVTAAIGVAVGSVGAWVASILVGIVLAPIPPVVVTVLYFVLRGVAASSVSIGAVPQDA